MGSKVLQIYESLLGSGHVVQQADVASSISPWRQLHNDHVASKGPKGAQFDGEGGREGGGGGR